MSLYPSPLLYPSESLYPQDQVSGGISDLLTLDCVIVRRSPGTETNAYGDLIPEENTLTTVCELQQADRDENTDRGEIGVSEWKLFLPAGTDVLFGDAVIVDETTYELVGPPWNARNPRTMVQSHIEATVRLTASTADPAGS